MQFLYFYAHIACRINPLCGRWNPHGGRRQEKWEILHKLYCIILCNWKRAKGWESSKMGEMGGGGGGGNRDFKVWELGRANPFVPPYTSQAKSQIF